MVIGVCHQRLPSFTREAEEGTQIQMRHTGRIIITESGLISGAFHDVETKAPPLDNPFGFGFFSRAGGVCMYVQACFCNFVIFTVATGKERAPLTGLKSSLCQGRPRRGFAL